MHNIYNSVLETYTRSFPDLPERQQFHFANRLYLWCQLPIARAWLDEMRSEFTAQEDPLQSLRQILEQPLPELLQSGELRQPYFERYPLLRSFERVMFRLLFLHTVYGIDSRTLLFQVLDQQVARKMYRDLLSDPEALLKLSSYAVNYLYLFNHFDDADDQPRLQPHRLLEIAQNGFTASTALERQIEGYFYSHCILSETLFYARAVHPEHRETHLQMLLELERGITDHIAETKLDVLYEYLVCCRILDRQPKLEALILERSQRALGPDGYITEPLLTHTEATLQNSEHRNVLFLLSQQPYQPLLKN